MKKKTEWHIYTTLAEAGYCCPHPRRRRGSNVSPAEDEHGRHDDDDDSGERGADHPPRSLVAIHRLQLHRLTRFFDEPQPHPHTHIYMLSEPPVWSAPVVVVVLQIARNASQLEYSRLFDVLGESFWHTGGRSAAHEFRNCSKILYSSPVIQCLYRGIARPYAKCLVFNSCQLSSMFNVNDPEQYCIYQLPLALWFVPSGARLHAVRSKWAI